ncbi:polysaccharide lyase family 8 protein [Gelatoporia subvermispora B]|uniref:Polysaccharide lyase family 8 protein n=1 Tax=Ceriporiopsis subvermispora (strain B) TaxID=914234 RepID=M2RSW6_CERS8|nr:polysaccharide lyase family 8 protein [Gelatoporia subvermispora B]
MNRRSTTSVRRTSRARKIGIAQYPLEETSSNLESGEMPNFDADIIHGTSDGPSGSPPDVWAGLASSLLDSGNRHIHKSPDKSPTDTTDELKTMHERRLTSIIDGISKEDREQVPKWVSTLTDGRWPDSEVDYTAGCNARRANWPAQDHWRRLLAMASVWYNETDGHSARRDDLRDSIFQGMEYWFSNDFTNPHCLDQGGTSLCPCTEPGLWNTNWYSNIILIPSFVGETGLLMGNTMNQILTDNYTHFTSRAYGTFDRYIHGLGTLTGANTLDVAKIGIDEALLTTNITLLADAYRRIHSEVVIQDAIMADGIRRDGSFGQHGGIIYNGNYGKDYLNDVLEVELLASGTQYAAGSTSRNAFTTLIDAIQWMIYRNVTTDVLHWDFSVLGRMISFPVSDRQATSSIKINVTDIGRLGQLWDSDTLKSTSESLAKPTLDANAGKLKGNRMFYANDYMVQRGPGYVTTIRMYSNRTHNTECVNSQNPLGFHLADGVQYTYLQGGEYEDIAAAWDWNLIPGITTDYGGTVLDGSRTQHKGVEAFAGGVSDGKIGIAAMRYTNPATNALSWQKTWFFLEDDVEHVMVPVHNSTSDAPVLSVLDQKRRHGAVLVDGVPVHEINVTGVRTLWHDQVGYVLGGPHGLPLELSVRTGLRTGNWSSIGTSKAGNATVDIFAAWISHDNAVLAQPLAYTIFPAVDYTEFLRKSLKTRLRTVQNDGKISAIYDEVKDIFMAVFWDNTGGAVEFSPFPYNSRIIIAASDNCALIYRQTGRTMTVADPSQLLQELQLDVTTMTRQLDGSDDWEVVTENVLVSLPVGGSAGSSVTMYL